MRTISVCCPTWRRFDLTVDAIDHVVDDERISEFIIYDDGSADGSYEKLRDFYNGIDKVKVIDGKDNIDCYFAKRASIGHATNEWAIIFDSDNLLTKDYIDKIFEIEEWDKHTSYMPVFAAPTFNYEAFSGLTISKENVASYMGEKLFDTMLNCFNMFINVEEYKRVWVGGTDPITADSIFFNYCWFAAGNKMYVVPALEYFHRISSDSHYVKNVSRTGNYYNNVVNKILQLK